MIARWSLREVDSEDDPLYDGMETSESGDWCRWEDIASSLSSSEKALADARGQLCRAREDFQHISEYWNGCDNYNAMNDALHHIGEVADAALSSSSPCAHAERATLKGLNPRAYHDLGKRTETMVLLEAENEELRKENWAMKEAQEKVVKDLKKRVETVERWNENAARLLAEAEVKVERLEKVMGYAQHCVGTCDLLASGFGFEKKCTCGLHTALAEVSK